MGTVATIDSDARSPYPRKRLFDVEEYCQMVKAGILSEDDRVELIEGEVLHMFPITTRHAAGVRRLNNMILRMLGEEALVDVQNPIVLTEKTAPQPDVVILRPCDDFYRAIAPKPEDVLLLVEVADSSLPYDRDIKVPLYARSGIPEMWLIDLAGQAIEVLKEPTPQGYRERRVLGRGQSLSPSAFPDLQLTVDQLLGSSS